MRIAIGNRTDEDRTQLRRSGAIGEIPGPGGDFEQPRYSTYTIHPAVSKLSIFHMKNIIPRSITDWLDQSSGARLGLAKHFTEWVGSAVMYHPPVP